jgi:CRISPR/Cas system-associated exonuclease Cas4 (RecB family)
MLGPHLFPLIADAEQKVIGTRLLPQRPGGPLLRSERYALHGIIDVLTHVELAGVGSDNIIRKAVEDAVGLSGTFEVIVDYKGSHRPAFDEHPDHWALGEWQVQTYAWLRQRQQLSHPVAAGILIYVNELAPGGDDLRRLRAAIDRGKTDVQPTRGDPDFYALQAWTPGAVARLSEEFRYRRAIRVIQVTPASIDHATNEFDQIVSEIEGRIVDEAMQSSIRATWPPTCKEEATCVACDFRYFCPRPAAAPDVLATANTAADDDDV